MSDSSRKGEQQTSRRRNVLKRRMGPWRALLRPRVAVVGQEKWRSKMQYVPVIRRAMTSDRDDARACGNDSGAKALEPLGKRLGKIPF